MEKKIKGSRFIDCARLRANPWILSPILVMGFFALVNVTYQEGFLLKSIVCPYHLPKGWLDYKTDIDNISDEIALRRSSLVILVIPPLTLPNISTVGGIILIISTYILDIHV